MPRQNSISLLRALIGILFLLYAAIPARAETIVAMSGGVGCPLFTGGLEQIAAQLHARGIHADVGCSFGSINPKPGDRVVLIGHSMGAVHAAEEAAQLHARGISVMVIALDPLLTGASCPQGIVCICFWQGGYPMPGAQNIRVPSNYGHIRFPADPRVQARVIAAVGR